MSQLANDYFAALANLPSWELDLRYIQECRSSLVRRKSRICHPVLHSGAKTEAIEHSRSQGALGAKTQNGDQAQDQAPHPGRQGQDTLGPACRSAWGAARGDTFTEARSAFLRTIVIVNAGGALSALTEYRRVAII